MATEPVRDEAMVVGHFYVSTACQHYRHNECRKVCKFCPSKCLCPCHKEAS